MFLGISLGQGLPYAQAFQELAKKSFSCHCCDHGKGNCKHCAQFGHKLQVKAKKAELPALKQVPCGGKSQKLQAANFVSEPFLAQPSSPIFHSYSAWLILERAGALSSSLSIPPTPPPQTLI